MAHGIEQTLVVDLAIFVRQEVSKSNDLAPRNFRVFYAGTIGHMSGGFADNLDRSFDCQADHFIGLPFGPAFPSDEFHGVARGL